MNNNEDNIISNENDLPSFTFKPWPLDEDDEEFRAGYPFSSVPSEELNEQEVWCDSSPTPNDDDLQLDNPPNKNSNETIKADDQSNRFLYDGHEKFMEFDTKFSTVSKDNSDYNVIDNDYNKNNNANENQNHEEREQNLYDQYSTIQIDNVNNKQTNQTHPVK